MHKFQFRDIRERGSRMVSVQLGAGDIISNYRRHRYRQRDGLELMINLRDSNYNHCTSPHSKSRASKRVDRCVTDLSSW